MTLQLTGRTEPQGLYRGFHGPPTEDMPQLMKAGYDLISVAGVIGRRESAPVDVVDEWRNSYFFTGDGVAYDGRKNTKVVLDAALLREINPNMKHSNYAMILSNDQWEELHGGDVLYLSTYQVAQASGKGFVKRNGVWQPENTVVGDVWNHLSRGKDVKDYAEMVHQASGNNKVMSLHFDIKTYYFSPVLRSLVVSSFDHLSFVLGGYNNLSYFLGNLAGVAQEMRKLEVDFNDKRV